MKLNAKGLRLLEAKNAQGELRNIKRNPIFFILENIYDTYNIGGLFRLADAIAAEKIYLCGEMEIPPNHKIKKASIGTYKIVPWEYRKSAREVIKELRKKVKIMKPVLKLGKEVSSKKKLNILTSKPNGYPNLDLLSIIAVEQHKIAVPYTQANYSKPLALIFGNESYGITSETLKLADQIVEIPMWGINKSLNVIVSAAIVSYWVMSKI